MAKRAPRYEEAAKERVIVRFGSSAERPTFALESHSESWLARDQRTGIDGRRYHEILPATGAI